MLSAMSIISIILTSFLLNTIFSFQTARLSSSPAPSSSTGPAPEYGCPDGWHHETVSGYCYLFTVDVWLQWTDARAYCVGLGADLTSIHSTEENDYIFSIILGFAWIGLHDQDTEGVFSTFADGTPVDYVNWAADNYQNSNRDCAYMKHDDNKVWFLHRCEITEFRFVCKKYHHLITTPGPTTTIHTTVALNITTEILCPTHVFTNREVWCAFLTNTVMEYSNYTFCFEDSEGSCSVAKPESWSLDDIPDALKESAASMNGFLASFHNYTYTAVGSYELTAVVDQTSAANVTLTVKHSCINSLSIDVKRHCDASYPAVYLRAIDIDISAYIELDENCIDPITSEFKWWIVTSTEEDSDVEAVFEKITHIPHLTIPSGTIASGNYSLNLKAETNRKLSDELTGVEEIATWFEIQPSPLVAVIKGGASRSHGLSSNLTVDGSTSYDPDVAQGSSSDLTFSWYCILVHSDIIYTSLQEVIQISDDACFEEGIMMDSTSSKLEVIASKLRANVTMNFWLLVSKEGRISGSTQQRIHLTPGLWLQIEISCISNCNTYIIATERLVLHASCTNRDNENEVVSFQWSLMSNHTSVIDDLSAQTTTGLDQSYLVIKPHTFDSTFDIGDVPLRVTGYLPDSGSFGYAEFDVKVSAPLSLGHCLVTPMEGYALQTDFTVSCSGFADVDDPLTFELILFNNVDVVDGNFVGLGKGFQLYEGSKPLKDGLFFPVGDGDYNRTVLLQVNVRDCYMATSVFMNATVHPVDVGENVNQELLDMMSSLESKVNNLLAVGDTGQAAQLISALGSILNSIGDEDDEGRQTRKEIRSSLVDYVAAIPLEFIVALRQSSVALAVITHNRQEISVELQMNAATVLAEMTSFLKSKSGYYDQNQEIIESAASILVETLSYILSAANVSQDEQNLSEVALSALGEIQDAIVGGKIPGEEATVITSPTLSIAVSSISRDKLAGATFECSDDEGLSSFSMPSTDGELDDIVDIFNGTALSIQMTALRWNPFSWGAGGESFNSSIIGILLKADHNIIQVQDLSADINVYLPMKEPLLRDPASALISKDFSAVVFVDHSSVPDEGAVHLKVIAENKPFATLCICTANININEKPNCLENTTVVGVSNEAFDPAANFTWSVSVADLKGADGIIIRLHDGHDDQVYGNENISLSLFIYTSQCSFWNEDQQEWNSTGCKVGPLSNPTTTHCLCNHLTFFGSSLTIPPVRISILKNTYLLSSERSVAVKVVVSIIIAYVLYCVVLFICIVSYFYITKRR